MTGFASDAERPSELLAMGEPEPDALEISYGRDILVVDDNQANLIAIEAALSPVHGRRPVRSS